MAVKASGVKDFVQEGHGVRSVSLASFLSLDSRRLVWPSPTKLPLSVDPATIISCARYALSCSHCQLKVEPRQWSTPRLHFICRLYAGTGCLSATASAIADDSGASGIVRVSIWLPHWRLPARGWLCSTDNYDHPGVASVLLCTTLQTPRSVNDRSVSLHGPRLWNDLPLAQRSMHHWSDRTFNRHFWQTSQNATIFCSMRLRRILTIWFLCAVYKCSYLLTCLLRKNFFALLCFALLCFTYSGSSRRIWQLGVIGSQWLSAW